MENSVNSWMRGSLIGQGAFGKVNLALDRSNGEVFAVKSIDWCPEESRMSGEMKAMENEVEILQSLKNSPFIVNCLGSSFTVENGKSVRNLFMEYMPGGSLVDLMKKFGGSGFEEPLIRNYSKGILAGIQYLHQEGIVHCDIKGRNVLVGSTGGVKLADFGGARRLGHDGGEVSSAVTGSNLLLNVKGTPLWMAPEVVRQVEQGPESDIWSLGCTVVEMATGKAPWSAIAGSNPFAALHHIGCTEMVPDLPSSLSEEGRDFLRKCFQRDPRRRWTAEQLLQHPFITDSFSVESKESAPLPSSPTSAFEFPSSSSSSALVEESTIVNSVPILRSPLQFFAKRFPKQEEQGPLNFVPGEESNQKEGTGSSTAGTDFWCNSPLSDFGGQWITVRTPKTVSPSSPSPTVSSFSAPESISTSEVVEEDHSVNEEIPTIVPSPCVEKEEVEQQHSDETLEITTSTAPEHPAPCSNSSSTTQVSSSCCNQRGEEYDTMVFSRPLNKSDNLEKCCCLSAAHVDDQRCMDTRGIPEANWASLGGTLRMTLAHGKLAFEVRGRPKPLRGRLLVCRELHDLLHGKFSCLGRAFNSLWLGERSLPHDRNCNDSFGGSLQRKFFRNRDLDELLHRKHSRAVNSFSFRGTSSSLERISEGSFVLGTQVARLQLSLFGDGYGERLQPAFFTDRLFLNKSASSLGQLIQKRSVDGYECTTGFSCFFELLFISLYERKSVHDHECTAGFSCLFEIHILSRIFLLFSEHSERLSIPNSHGIL